MNRAIFVNRYFWPDHSATSQILSDLTFHLAESGQDVTVIAGNQLYEDPSAVLPAYESVRGVKIHRVSSTRFGRDNLGGRAIDYISLYKSLRRAALDLTRAGDILVAKTDPPMLSLFMAHVARRRNGYLVNWLQDLYPEVAIELGLPFLSGVLGSGLKQLRDSSLYAASANVVLGELMAERLRQLGVKEETIHLIHNWVDNEAIRPVPHSENPLRQQWQLEGKFVVGYSGNLGRAHEFHTLLGAAEQLRSRRDIAYLFIGGGNRSAELRRLVESRGLGAAFHFQPYQDRAALEYSLSVPDIHWISLKPEFEGLIVPSKLYGALAAGRPIIAVSASDGEIATIVRSSHSGLQVNTGDAIGLAHAIARFADSPVLTQEIGAQARSAVEQRYNRRSAFEIWQKLLDQVGRVSGPMSAKEVVRASPKAGLANNKVFRRGA